MGKTHLHPSGNRKIYTYICIYTDLSAATRYLAPGTGDLVSGAWYSATGTRHQVFGTDVAAATAVRKFFRAP